MSLGADGTGGWETLDEQRWVQVSAKWKKELRGATEEIEPVGQCKRCGACCAFISIPPFREDELDQLPADILQVIAWYTQHDAARPKSPVPCYFFDMTSRMCLIHEHKPQTCRDFEPGGPACRKERSDLLGPLNHYYNATKQWARHYTRIVAPGVRIQEIGEFSLDDEVVEGLLKE